MKQSLSEMKYMQKCPTNHTTVMSQKNVHILEKWINSKLRHSQTQKSPFSKEMQEISAVSRRPQDNPEELENM